MKMKLAVAAVLASASVGFIAPAVEAGRLTSSASCTYMYDSVTGSLSVNGSFSGVRFASILQGTPSGVRVDYTDYTHYSLDGGTWTQTGRTSGDYARSGQVPAGELDQVYWAFYNSRYVRLGEATCIPSA